MGEFFRKITRSLGIRGYICRFRNKFQLIAKIIVLISLLGIYKSATTKNKNSNVNFYKDEDVFIKIQNSPICPKVHCIGLSNKYFNVRECKNHTLCKLYNHTPIRFFHPKIICNDFIKCVTAIVQTRKRGAEMVKLIKSAWKYFPGLQFAIADEYLVGENISSEFMSLLEKEHLIQYFQIADNSGVALGRNVALLMAKTPYVLLLDDEFVFEESTKFDSAFNLLISTDISVAAGIVSNCDYAGVLKLNQGNNSTIIEHIYNTVYYYIPKSDDCFKADFVDNFFLANRKDILEISGWSNIFKVAEHEDFFIKLRLAGKNVAVCPKVYIKREVIHDKVQEERINDLKIYSTLFNNQWNISSFNVCHIKDYDKLICNIKP